MFKIDFNKKIKVHFLGIGGISMSSLALILKNAGMDVSGSDITHQNTTDILEKKGIKVFYSQVKENITDDIDLVIWTASIDKNNEELKECIDRNIPCMTRSKLLGEIMSNYKNAINVAGTHGKTTTTSMISKVVLDAKLDPTITVGGMLPCINGNLRIGGKDYFVTEACEYTNSFLDFKPTANVILDIEEDHLDFFKDINDIRSSFKKFIDLLPSEGLLVINKTIYKYEELIKDCKAKVVTYSLNNTNNLDADYYAKNIIFDDNAKPHFDVYNKNEFIGKIELGVVGLHNVENALACIATCLNYGISFDIIQKSLKTFTGADRRFEFKGYFQGAKVFDDYAHHPSEIKSTLNAAMKLKYNKMFLIYQPHTYSRTKSFLKDFANVLSFADDTILAPIYAAREQNTFGISSKDILTHMTNGKHEYFDTFEEIEEYLHKNVHKDDLVITMGAGTIFQIADNLIKK